jgi:hypothetical protein
MNLIILTLIIGVNTMEMPQPRNTGGNVYESGIIERVYQLNYKRWLYFCRRKGGIAVSEAFGRTVLRHLLKVHTFIHFQTYI